MAPLVGSQAVFDGEVVVHTGVTIVREEHETLIAGLTESDVPGLLTEVEAARVCAKQSHLPQRSIVASVSFAKALGGNSSSS